MLRVCRDVSLDEYLPNNELLEKPKAKENLAIVDEDKGERQPILRLADLVLLIFYCLVNEVWNYADRKGIRITRKIMGLSRCEQVIWHISQKYQKYVEFISFQEIGNIVISLQIREEVDQLIEAGLLAREIRDENWTVHKISYFQITDEGINAFEEFVLPLILQYEELNAMFQILREELPTLISNPAIKVRAKLSSPQFWCSIRSINKKTQNITNL